MGNHTTALRMLLAGKEHAGAAECCLDAAAEALRQHHASLRRHLAEGGGDLLDVAAAAAAPAGTHAAAAAAARRRALAWLAKAVEQVFLANNLETLAGLLSPPRLGRTAHGGDGAAEVDSGDELDDDEADAAAAEAAEAATAVFAPLVPELHDMLRRRWAGSYGRALQRVALRCHGRGEHARARRALRQMPAETERDALLARLGYWREQARLRR